MPIDAILVPRGAEYQAVVTGLEWPASICTYAVPAGPGPLAAHLDLLPKAWQRVLLVGLCGSLVPEYALGDVVVYGECVRGSAVLQCDPELTQTLGRSFPTKPVVRALTTGHVLCSADEKRRLGERHQAAVVDMEGFAALEVLSRAGIKVGMVRVVSDDCHHDLPDLNGVLGARGNLQPLPLALALLRRPVEGLRLVHGSIQALRVLRQVARELASI